MLLMKQLPEGPGLISLEEITAKVHPISSELLLSQAHHLLDFAPRGLPLTVQGGPGLQPTLLCCPGLHIDGAPPVNRRESCAIRRAICKRRESEY